MKIILILVAFLYFVFPFDLIRDFFPIIGYLDDLTLIIWIIYLLNKKRNNANNYKSNNNTYGNKETPNKDSYDILGIGKNITKQELKKVYKEMASKYHPDKVAHLGDELKEHAKKKFIEINNAYESILKEKGWS